MSRILDQLRRLAAVFAFAGLTPIAAHGDDAGDRVELRPIDSNEMLTFATRFFYKRYPSPPNWSFGARFNKRENWSTAVREHGYAATAELGIDGSRALVLVVDSVDWCYDDGCLAAIFRPGPKGYEFICEAALALAGAVILPQTENGYHLLATRNRIIHWSEQQAFDSGTLCDIKSR